MAENAAEIGSGTMTDECRQLLQQLTSASSADAASMQATTQELCSTMASMDAVAKAALLAEGNAGEALATVLKTAAVNNDVQTANHAFDCVTLLCSEEGTYESRIVANLTALAACGVLETVVKSLATLVQHSVVDKERHGNSLPQVVSDMVSAGCDCIASLSFDDDNNVALGTHGACMLMSAMLDQLQEEPAVVSSVCTVLRELLCSEANSTRFRHAGGCARLWQTLVNHLQQPSAERSPIWDTCAYLLRYPEGRQAWFELNAAPVIVGAFREHMQNATVVVGLADIVTEFCRGDQAVTSQLGEGGFCTSIFQAVGVYENDPQVVSTLCGALVNLAALDDNKLRIVQANGDVVVAQVLGSFGADPVIARRAARLLTVICDVPGRTAALSAAGANNAVLQTMLEHLNDALIVEPLCRVLTVFGLEDTDENVREWGSSATELLVAVLERHASVPEVVAVACCAISAVIDKQHEAPEMRVRSSAAACQNVFAALVNHGQHLLAFSGACRAVTSLSRNVDHAQWFAQAGVFEALYQSMRYFTQLPAEEADPLPLERAQLVWVHLIVLPEAVAFLRTHADIFDMMRLLIQRNFEDRLTALSFCNTVAAFGNQSEHLSTLCEAAGHCELVARVLEAYIEFPDVVHWACLAIRHLCNARWNQTPLAQARACQLVPLALSRHVEVSPTNSSCGQALVALCRDNLGNAALLGDAGAVAAAMQLLVLRLREPLFARGCCDAFATLCHGNPREAHRLREANISGALARIFEIHLPDEGVIREALRVIINLCEVSAQAQIAELGQAGLCQAVMSALASHRESVEVVRLGSTAIVRLCEHVEAGNRRRFLDSGALGALHTLRAVHFVTEIEQAIQLVATAASSGGSDE